MKASLLILGVLSAAVVACSSDDAAPETAEVATTASVAEEQTPTAVSEAVTVETTSPITEGPPGCFSRWPDDPVFTVCVDPPVVPAEVGMTKVMVTGIDFLDLSEVFVYSCPIDLPCDGPGDEAAVAREEGRLVNVTLGPDGTFSTPLVVDIDDIVIEQGGLAIVAGDIWVPEAGRTELQVGE